MDFGSEYTQFGCYLTIVFNRIVAIIQCQLVELEDLLVDEIQHLNYEFQLTRLETLLQEVPLIILLPNNYFEFQLWKTKLHRLLTDHRPAQKTIIL